MENWHKNRKETYDLVFSIKCLITTAALLYPESNLFKVLIPRLYSLYKVVSRSSKHGSDILKQEIKQYLQNDREKPSKYGKCLCVAPEQLMKWWLAFQGSSNGYHEDENSNLMSYASIPDILPLEVDKI